MLGGGRRVLMLGGEGVSLYLPTGKGIQKEVSIAWSVPNFEGQLAEALSSQHASIPVLILYDGAEQTYRKEENIPKLSAFDRPRFIKRKLELAFPNYPVRAAMEIKGTKVRSAFNAAPNYLFVALMETEHVNQVGAALYESGVPVAGFSLLPAEAADLVTELSKKTFVSGKRSRWSVLVGQHETSGLRQVLVKDGNLALTRLTPTSEAGTSGPGWVEEVSREIRSTLTYISRYGYTPEDGIDVIVVCGDIEKQFFDKNMPVSNFRCINTTEAMRQIGFRSIGQEKNNFSDAVYAGWIGKKAKLNLTMKVPSIQRVQAPRQAARMGSIVLALTALGGAYLGAQAYFDYDAIQQETALKQNQVVVLQREYDGESQVFDGLPARPEVVKAALSVKSLLETNTVNLRPILHRLKDTVGGDIHMEELQFTHEPGTGLNLSGSSKNAMFTEVSDPNDRGKVLIRFKFGLPTAMPLEQKVKRAETLAEDLKKAFPGYAVSIVSQFGRVQRGGQFAGDVGATNAAPAPAEQDLAEFEMRGVPL